MKQKQNRLRITKVKTTHYDILDIPVQPFMSYSKFSDTRTKLGLKVEGTCFRCERPFDKETDDLYLIFTNKGNRLICKECHDELIKEKEL